MHLSYRGVAQPSSSSAVVRRRSTLLRRGQQLAHQVKEVSAQAIASRNRSARRVASLPSYTDMATLLKSSAATRVLEDSTLEAQYHSLERSLQLAYAVGDRDRIATLEAEIEQLTGWRFNRRR